MAIELSNTNFRDRFDEYGKHVLVKGYIYDSENKKQINECIQVIEEDEVGLLILGNPGSGKTLFFEMAQRITHPESQNFFLRMSVLDVVLKFNDKNIAHKVFRTWQDKNVFFDDLGTEDKGYNFGEKVEVFEKFIQFRYDLFRSKKIKTHFTTNLSYDELKQRYGLRCVSRLGEMCHIVLLGEKATSSDRRKLRNFIHLPQVIHRRKPDPNAVDYEQYKKNHANEKPEPYMGMGSKLRESIGTDKKKKK